MTARSRPGLPPYSFVGPLQNQQPMGTGIILQLGSSVSAGGSLTLTHSLGRIPVFAAVIVDPAPNYPSRVKITSSSSTQADVEFESAQSADAFLYID